MLRVLWVSKTQSYSGMRAVRGLRMFPGSHALRSCSIATSSDGVRDKLSHGALATPIPCSAEIVPPKDVAKRHIASSASN